MTQKLKNKSINQQITVNPLTSSSKLNQEMQNGFLNENDKTANSVDPPPLPPYYIFKCPIKFSYTNSEKNNHRSRKSLLHSNVLGLVNYIRLDELELLFYSLRWKNSNSEWNISTWSLKWSGTYIDRCYSRAKRLSSDNYAALNWNIAWVRIHI